MVGRGHTSVLTLVVVTLTAAAISTASLSKPCDAAAASFPSASNGHRNRRHNSPQPPRRAVNASFLDGKVLFGYQGWFDTPGSGTGRGWVHWSPGVPPNATNCTFDVWPAMGEYAANDTAETLALTARGAASATITPIRHNVVAAANVSVKSGGYGGGGDDVQASQAHSPLRLYSAARRGVADLHFGWMRDYGIDGVFVQRFVSGLEHGRSATMDSILVNAVRAAEATGRVVSVMYDISGANEGTWDTTIRTDWSRLTSAAALNLTRSPAWLHHNGKPVMAVWGLGFTAHPGTPAAALALLRDLQQYNQTEKQQQGSSAKGQEEGGVTLVAGVPTHWRSGDGDSRPGFETVYAAADVLSPWLVGRFATPNDFDRYMQSTFVADKTATDARKQGYAPVVFPGFSWANLMRTTGQKPSPYNQIPRHGGAFWSYQAASWANLKPSRPLFIYGAMFDEVDEGTAMFKGASTLEETPREGQFVYYSIDGQSVPSDRYLELAGNFTAHFRAGDNNGDGAAAAGDGSVGDDAILYVGGAADGKRSSDERNSVMVTEEEEEDWEAAAKERASELALRRLRARQFLDEREYRSQQ